MTGKWWFEHQGNVKQKKGCFLIFQLTRASIMIDCHLGLASGP